MHLKKIGLDLLIYYRYIEIHTSKATPSQQSTTLNPYWLANGPEKGKLSSMIFAREVL